MKCARIPFVAVVLTIVIGFLGSQKQTWAQSPQASQPAWQQIPIPKLPEFHPPQPKRFVLPNGMVIFLQEDHE